MAISIGGYTQEIQNGKLVDNSASATSLSGDAKKDGDNTKLGHMDFINLLVAEMQNQDPLEPSSNTDYVAQMATFSQVQALEDMKGSMSDMNADNLVGKYVTLQVKDNSGNVSEVTGKVDYVSHENGKSFVSVEDKLYNVDDVVTVMDTNYSDANVMAATFNSLVGQLPPLANLTEMDAENVAKTRYVYDSMDAYTKQFVDKNAYEKFQALEEACKNHGWGAYAAGGAYGPAAGGQTEGTDTGDGTDAGTTEGTVEA